MPPKRTELTHVTFHFHRSAVLLSVPGSTSLGALKKQLLPAIQPLADTLPSAPQSDADIRLFEDKPITDGSQEKAGGLRSLEDEQKTRSLTALGWDRWKKVYVSFRDSNGDFADAEYTVPSNDDGEVDEE